MQPVFADPKTDYVFKRIFGAVEHKALLIALLNHMLELEGERRILDVRHLSPEQRISVEELKLSIVDVKCTDATGRHFVVEMQVLNVEGFEKRVVYNASKAYVMQLGNADGYPQLCDVVGVTICNFNLWPERDNSGQYKVPMLSRWRMQEQHSGEPGLLQVQYAFLELPKYAAGDAPVTLIDRWAYFFRETKNLNVVPPALSEQPFRGALEVARSASFSPEEWEAYQRAKMAEQDARGALTLVEKEALVKGHKLGVTEGQHDMLLRRLERAGFVVTDAQRALIAACTDPATLDRWLDRAYTAKTVAEVLS
jgi:predicted transposase/invertase (TIGR01784 family)